MEKRKRMKHIMKKIFSGIYLILIFLIQACSFTANISLLTPESAYVYIAPSKVTLKSSYFAQTDQVTFSTEDCDDFKQFLVTENISLVPLGHESDWQTCSTSTNEINYQLITRRLERITFMFGVKIIKIKLQRTHKELI